MRAICFRHSVHIAFDMGVSGFSHSKQIGTLSVNFSRLKTCAGERSDTIFDGSSVNISLDLPRNPHIKHGSACMVVKGTRRQH